MLLCGSYGTPLRTFKGKRTLEQVLPLRAFRGQSHPAASRRRWWRKLIPTELAYQIATRFEINGELIRRDDFFPYLEHMARVDVRLFLEMLAAAGRHTARELLAAHRRADADRRRAIATASPRRTLSEEMHRADPRLRAVRGRRRLAHRADRAARRGHRAHRRLSAQEVSLNRRTRLARAAPVSGFARNHWPPGACYGWSVQRFWVNRVVRVISLVLFAVALGLLVHRLRRTPEQQELTHYVEVELPSLFSVEKPIDERIARLNQTPGLKPEEARALLVDDVIPRLVKLRRQAEGLTLKTAEARGLNLEYLRVIDQLIDACRACVRVIDDPRLPDGAGLVLVRERFADVHRALQAWDEQVRASCVRHRLAKPSTQPRR